jgi:hypothetical protein
MEERRGAYRALVGKPEGRNHLEDPGIDGTIILKRIFERLGGRVGHELDLSGSGLGQLAGSCVCGDEPLGSIKCGEVYELQMPITTGYYRKRTQRLHEKRLTFSSDFNEHRERFWERDQNVWP